MRKISCPHKGYPFFLSPPGKRLHLHILAGGPAIFGMDVKISDESHHSQILISNSQNNLVWHFEFG
jgi:hypothetical protein